MDFSTKPKIELHVHLDACCRLDTLLEVARKRNLPLPAQTVDELRNKIRISSSNGVSLDDFLSKFNIFMPVLAGNGDAIERLAFEWCQHCAEQRVVYSEVRYAPHILANTTVLKGSFAPQPGDLSPGDVVRRVNAGLAAGTMEFGVKVRTILVCMTHLPEWASEVLDLCVEFRDRGVVAIDLAGSEHCPLIQPCDEAFVQVFKEAKRLGINRVVHAGEAGSYANITQALDILGAQRIGHGYRSVDNPDVYDRLLSSNVHLETCPHSSFATGCVPPNTTTSHPISRFAKDGMNFSISTDDPIVTGTTLVDEYRLCKDQLGLTDQDIVRSIFCAAEAALLPDSEKEEVLEVLRRAYGVVV